MSDALLQRAKALHLHGLAAHWAEVVGEAGANFAPYSSPW